MFDGWAPREVHERYDADGNLTGTTVVTHEPVWSDEDRARALALDDYEQSLCPCGCQQPIVEATDKARAFVIEDFTCYARRALAKHERVTTERAEKTKKPDGWADGLSHYISRSFVPEPRRRGGQS